MSSVTGMEEHAVLEECERGEDAAMHKYEAALKSDKFLLLAHGTADEVAKARDILQTTHAMEIAVHAPQRGQLAESVR